ncbi:uncharacterized protein LOC100844990 isoform X1 [Brachypodium distachyon]|uniref:uncharacterized protein LOC100844990 isoform X1 n=1 Tax=Brachypodium distachyon TaxID=15368 RepID=UPI00071DF266|nr:uncharacterized protein LOC100844990 isoform X1 [Brachypodium distachyon]|eukprot:XP_014756149.1 uncharacterized protein LOC100844990 isoform X1 [Brachypodium distachyon]
MASPSSMAALLLLLLVVAASAAEAAAGSTVVAGMVFCDQCKDGARGLFDYPLYGARVAIQCGGGETPLTVRECNTNWFGGFSVRMEGSPDMNRCTARLIQGTPHCPGGGSTAAPQQRDLTLAFRMLGLALYTVQPLLSHPDHPMDFCPAAAPPVPDPTAAAAAPSSYAPVAPVSSPPLPFWRRPRPRRLPPIWRRPPTIPQDRPGLPEPETKPKPADAQIPTPPPTTPVGSACTYEYLFLTSFFFCRGINIANIIVSMDDDGICEQQVGRGGAAVPLEGGDAQHDGGHGVRAPRRAEVRRRPHAAGRARRPRRHVPHPAPGGHGGAAQRVLQPARFLVVVVVVPVPDHGQRHRPPQRRTPQRLHAAGAHRGRALPPRQCRWWRAGRADQAALRLDALQYHHHELAASPVLR